MKWDSNPRYFKSMLVFKTNAFNHSAIHYYFLNNLAVEGLEPSRIKNSLESKPNVSTIPPYRVKIWRMGFEPTILQKYADLANRCLQPLSHLPPFYLFTIESLSNIKYSQSFSQFTSPKGTLLNIPYFFAESKQTKLPSLWILFHNSKCST